MRVAVAVASRIVASRAAALALVGCAEGQISQTSREFSAVDGTFGDVGNSLALRDVLIPYPANPNGQLPQRIVGAGVAEHR